MKTLKFVGTYIVTPLAVSALATAGFVIGMAAAGEVLDRVRPKKPTY